MPSDQNKVTYIFYANTTDPYQPPQEEGNLGWEEIPVADPSSLDPSHGSTEPRAWADDIGTEEQTEFVASEGQPPPSSSTIAGGAGGDSQYYRGRGRGNRGGYR